MRRSPARIKHPLLPFQLTHLLRGATSMSVAPSLYSDISTHAPLARCDYHESVNVVGDKISTHAPLARCDTFPFSSFTSTHLFQLTHLLRGATISGKDVVSMSNFNSRTSCEVRHRIIYYTTNPVLISTHAPLARCDAHAKHAPSYSSKFQLTHLLRGATRWQKLK